MRYKWLNKNNNDKLIVFFNGWGMDDKVISHLDCEDFDVLAFCDYETFEIPNFDFSTYSKKYLIAWSMGVFVCNYFYEAFCNFDKYIAINGTQKPIDDEFGISKKIYDLTVNNFNELSCAKFMKKISSSVDLNSYKSRSNEELKNELTSIRDLKVKNYFNFDESIVSDKDRIIPTQNQINFWNKQGVTVKSEIGAHYIFDKYKNWRDFL